MPLLIDIRKLRVINKLIQDGAGNVASSLESLAGVESTVEIKSLSFVDPEDIPAQMGSGDLYSASITLTEPPYGVFMITFLPDTAVQIAELMTNQPVEESFNQLHESALQEMCNILTSGFIDGIANTMGTTINMGTPNLESGSADALAETTMSHVQTDSLSIVLDSLVDVVDEDTTLQLRIFLVPDPGAFVNLIDNMSLDV
jgi:chemotaxis protein CheC